MIQPVPFPEFRPDLTTHSEGVLRAENVLPMPDGYRGVGALSAASDALAGTFQGAASAISDDGSAFLLAGTGSTLYKLGSTGAWTSLVTGLSITGRWRFAQFNNYAIVVNGAATRVVDLGAGTDSALAGAPSGTCVAAVGDHVVIGQTDGNVSTVRWSAFNDHTGWTIGTDQSGEQPMTNGGAVMGIAGGEYGVILQRDRIVRMSRTGNADTPFYFDEISSNFGCAAAATIAQAGRSVFFLSDRGFMALDDGQALRPIGTEKVDRSFVANIARSDLESLFAAVDPANKLVFWGRPGAPGQIWVYNFELDRWATLSLAFNGLFPGYTTSIGLEDLAVIYPDLDAMTISLDDPRWQGGAPRMYLVGSDNKLGTLSGAKLAARIDLPFLELATGRRARVRKVRPVTDAIGGITLELNAKARLGDVQNAATWGSITSSGIVPVRASGRYISISTRIAAGTVWDYIQRLEVELGAGGMR